MADLGVTAVRYPILWERSRPNGRATGLQLERRRLAQLRERGIKVIRGLLITAPDRATPACSTPTSRRLADYAARVAERYPWIEVWTPVNEPLTTARFSGLYGHWYPHGRDDRPSSRLVNHAAASPGDGGDPRLPFRTPGLSRPRIWARP